MSTPQLASFRERVGPGALLRRAEKVQRRKSFREEAAEVFGESTRRLIEVEQGHAALKAKVERGFFGRLKYLLLGR